MLDHARVDCLKKTVFFGMLPEDILKRVVAEANLRHIKQGESICSQGEPATSVFCVTEGAVKLTVSRSNGLDIVVDIFHSGSTFAEALLFRDAIYPVSGVALTDSEVIAVPKSVLEAALRAEPDTIPSLLTATYMHLHRLLRQIEHLKASSGRQRVAEFILALADHDGGKSKIRIPYEKQTLASMLGMQPETLSRAFRRLADHGVHVDGPMIEITDPGALEALINAD